LRYQEEKHTPDHSHAMAVHCEDALEWKSISSGEEGDNYYRISIMIAAIVMPTIVMVPADQALIPTRQATWGLQYRPS
jgi:hypothetical protein